MKKNVASEPDVVLFEDNTRHRIVCDLTSDGLAFLRTDRYDEELDEYVEEGAPDFTCRGARQLIVKLEALATHLERIEKSGEDADREAAIRELKGAGSE